MMIVKQHRVAIGVVAIVLVVVIALIIVEIILNGTGFAGKTLWDWLQLLAALAIPVVVGFGAVWFTTRQGKVADRANTDNQREAALQAYLDKMSELLLHEHLRGSKPEDEIRQIAQARTLTILLRLDSVRKRSVLQFLYETHLIDIFDWSDADLSGAALSGINLSKANLSKANLSGAYLGGADLSGSKFSGAQFYGAFLPVADLTDADLSGANLSGANLSGANLSGANLSGANLSGANLDGANLSKSMYWPTKRWRISQMFESDRVSEQVDQSWYWKRGLLVRFLSGNTQYVAFKDETKLSGANLSRAYLGGADLSGSNLERANLKEAGLFKTNLTRANLKEANLTKVEMNRAKLTIVVIYSFFYPPSWLPTSFVPTWRQAIDWSTWRGLLKWADLEKGDSVSFPMKLLSTTEAKNLLGKTDGNQARLTVVNLKTASLKVVKLEAMAADLQEADLSGADLADAELRGVNLSRANLSGAHVTPEQLNTAKSLKGAMKPDGSIHP